MIAVAGPVPVIETRFWKPDSLEASHTIPTIPETKSQIPDSNDTGPEFLKYNDSKSS
jgi:hypothetical protein